MYRREWKANSGSYSSIQHRRPDRREGQYIPVTRLHVVYIPSPLSCCLSAYDATSPTGAVAQYRASRRTTSLAVLRTARCLMQQPAERAPSFKDLRSDSLNRRLVREVSQSQIGDAHFGGPERNCPAAVRSASPPCFQVHPTFDAPSIWCRSGACCCRREVGL